MKETRITMGMPATIEIVDAGATQDSLDRVFAFFNAVDERFSPYKTESELSRFNRGEIAEHDVSADMQTIFALAEQTKHDTNGYFDIMHNGVCDPSGIVKGWAIHEGANLLRAHGFENFYVEIAGDIEVSGHNADGNAWTIGIRNPFNRDEIVKVVHLSGGGIATSGEGYIIDTKGIATMTSGFTKYTRALTF